MNSHIEEVKAIAKAEIEKFRKKAQEAILELLGKHKEASSESEESFPKKRNKKVSEIKAKGKNRYGGKGNARKEKKIAKPLTSSDSEGLGLTSEEESEEIPVKKLKSAEAVKKIKIEEIPVKKLKTENPLEKGKTSENPIEKSENLKEKAQKKSPLLQIKSVLENIRTSESHLKESLEHLYSLLSTNSFSSEILSDNILTQSLQELPNQTCNFQNSYNKLKELISQKFEKIGWEILHANLISAIGKGSDSELLVTSAKILANLHLKIDESEVKFVQAIITTVSLVSKDSKSQEFQKSSKAVVEKWLSLYPSLKIN